MEKGHNVKVWKRARRFVLLGREGRLRCRLVDIDKKRMGSF